MKAQRGGNLKKFEKLYEKKFKDEPGSAEVHHWPALINYEKEDFKKAEFEIQQAILSNPNFPDYYRSLGNVKNALGKTEEALSAYRMAISLNCEDTSSIYASGAILQKYRNYIAAESCYKRCLSINPNIAEAYYNLGLILKEQGKRDAAVKSLERAIFINPNFMQAINNLALLYYEKGRIVSAIKKFKNAIEIDPKFVLTYYNLGKILQDVGRFYEALRNYLKAIEVNPNFVECYNNIGICFEKLGSSEKAIKYLNESIRLIPKNANAYYNLGIIYHHKNLIKSAIQFTKKSINIDNKNKKAYYALFEQLREACCWNELSELTPLIERLTSDSLKKNIKPDESPSLSITRTEDLKRNKRIAELWSKYLQDKIKNNDNKAFRKIHSKKNKITIGYLSNRFRNAATGHLMKSMFGFHDKNLFDVHCYSWGPNDGSCYRKIIEEKCRPVY